MKKLLLSSVLFLILFASISSAQTVYITKSGKKYHSSGCSYLRKSSIPIELKEAKERGYSACSKCGIYSSDETESTESTKATSSSSSSRSSYSNSSSSGSYQTSGRCQATTKKGTQCKRNASSGSKYCWQHQ